MGNKIDYTKKLKPIYIDSIEANHIYIQMHFNFISQKFLRQDSIRKALQIKLKIC